MADIENEELNELVENFALFDDWPAKQTEGLFAHFKKQEMHYG